MCILKIQHYKHRTHAFHSFCHFGLRIWNPFPIDLRYCSTLSSLKTKFKTILCSQYFYHNSKTNIQLSSFRVRACVRACVCMCACVCVCVWERERETETETETDRQTGRQAGRQAGRQRSLGSEQFCRPEALAAVCDALCSNRPNSKQWFNTTSFLLHPFVLESGAWSVLTDVTGCVLHIT